MVDSEEKNDQNSYYNGKRILKGIWKGQEIEYLATEIIIKFNDDTVKQLANPITRMQLRDNLLGGMPKGFKIIQDFDRFGRLIIEVDTSEELFSIINELERNPAIKYAEPNIIDHIYQIIPNEYPNLPSLQTNQWALNRIRAPWGWALTTGGSDVLISIVDSGIAMPDRVLDSIYRWFNSKNGDHFYTRDPAGEIAPDTGYMYEGSPFRLFPAGTPDTTTFFRWVHPTRGDHFYTTDPSGEFAPSSGYTPQGNIGFIATKKISSRTVELFRWRHSTTGNHFYTTDPSGGFAPSSGYSYEGEAGFVNDISTSSLSHPDLSQITRITLGSNRVNASNFPIDDNGHGTHVCGICTADTNNFTGIAGVCWNCNVHIVKVFDLNGNGTSSGFFFAIVEAVDLAVSKEVRLVINYSAGGSDSKSKEEAVRYARDRNTIIVASTGNDSNRTQSPPLLNPVGYPAAYSLQYNNVIAVGSIDNLDNIAASSNEGPEVNVVAPGVGIWSTMPNYVTTLNPGGVAFLNQSGTSMATPHVTGLVSLILSINPTISPERVRQIVETTADNLGTTGRDDTFGHGCINCERALDLLRANNIFRWRHPTRGDHFYTPDPSGEFALSSGYISEGVFFRLFPAGTPDTRTFYRWANYTSGDHFYTTDPSGEFAPSSGYTPEGNIGFIATKKISSRTVELFRWRHPETGDHFYTTSPSGERAPSSGYISEGIAGWVELR
jgi:subtilisin family serine protease